MAATIDKPRNLQYKYRVRHGDIQPYVGEVPAKRIACVLELEATLGNTEKL